MLILTDTDILKDIEDFEMRIQAAQNKLASLPEGHLTITEHKKREASRRVLTDEIKHVKNLINIAREALQ